jgi:hypothetical protein
MNTEKTEPRSDWLSRLISPKFNDELNLWMSTIPVFCGIIQCLLVFYYYVRFVGLVFVGIGSAGGILALLFVVIALCVSLGLLVAFLAGIVYGLGSIMILFEYNPWPVIVWLALLSMGSLLKNTSKVKEIGDNENEYALPQAYFWGMAATALIVLYSIIFALTTEGFDTESVDKFLVPFAVFAYFIAVFHCIVKPAITSLIILNIFFFKKKVTTSQYRQDESIEKEKGTGSLLSYLGAGLVIVFVLVGLFFFSNTSIDTARDMLLKNNNKISKAQQANIASKVSDGKVPTNNWNTSYMIPGENFSFNKLNIKNSYNQLIRAARQGDKEAKIQVALQYMYGIGVLQDFEKAVYWFKKSAKDNHPQGQKMLAFTYYGTENEKAFIYFRKSAQQGDMEAQYWLSRLYYNGEGVVKNRGKADYWNKKAVAQTTL